MVGNYLDTMRECGLNTNQTINIDQWFCSLCVGIMAFV